MTSCHMMRSGFMPTKTFLNLPIQKQEALIKAAEREFERVDFSNASINQIIQDANIPRGSFYMYFEDKEDLYFYIVEMHMSGILEELTEIIKQQNGDFIRAWKILYTRLLDYCLLDEKGKLLQKIFLNMRYATARKLDLKPPKDVIKKKHHDLITNVDKDLYNYDSEEVLLDSFSLVMLIATSSIVYTLMNPLEMEKEKENFFRRLEIVGYGIYRKEKKNA